VDGRVERNDCTDVCCTKLQKTRETGLVFPNFLIQRGRTFFSFRRQSWRCMSLHRLFCFSTNGGILRTVPKGLHGHAGQLQNTCSPGVSRCVWKVTRQRCGLAYIIGIKQESVVCRVRLAGYLVRWGKLQSPTGNSWAHFSKPSVSKT